MKVLQERYYDVCASSCFNKAVLICRIRKGKDGSGI